MSRNPKLPMVQIARADMTAENVPNRHTAKRQWFHFSLITAILMMIVSSLMLWLNIKPSYHVSENNGCVVSKYTYGFPCTFYRIGTLTNNNNKQEIRNFAGGFQEMLMLNILISIFIVILCGVLCERLSRRSKDKALNIRHEAE